MTDSSLPYPEKGGRGGPIADRTLRAKAAWASTTARALPWVRYQVIADT